MNAHMLGVSSWKAFERLDEHVNRDIILSEDTIKACDRAGELMNAERSKLRVQHVDNINHSRYNILTRERKIKDLESRIKIDHPARRGKERT